MARYDRVAIRSAPLVTATTVEVKEKLGSKFQFELDFYDCDESIWTFVVGVLNHFLFCHESNRFLFCDCKIQNIFCNII